MASTITSNVGNLSAQFLTVGLAFALALIKMTAEQKELMDSPTKLESGPMNIVNLFVNKGWVLGADG